MGNTHTQNLKCALDTLRGVHITGVSKYTQPKHMTIMRGHSIIRVPATETFDRIDFCVEGRCFAVYTSETYAKYKIIDDKKNVWKFNTRTELLEGIQRNLKTGTWI